MNPNELPDEIIVYCENRPEAREFLRICFAKGYTLHTFPIGNADKVDYNYLLGHLTGRNICFYLSDGDIDFYSNTRLSDLATKHPDIPMISFSDLELPYKPVYMTGEEALRWLKEHNIPSCGIQNDPAMMRTFGHAEAGKVIADFPVDEIIKRISAYEKEREALTNDPEQDFYAIDCDDESQERAWQFFAKQDYTAEVYIESTGKMISFLLSDCPDEKQAKKKTDQLVKRCFPKGTKYLLYLKPMIHQTPSRDN